MSTKPAGRRRFPTRDALGWMLLGVLPGLCVAAAEPPAVPVSPGERIGIVNLLDAEVTHFHAARSVQDSYLKTYPVAWPVAGMLSEALRERLGQLQLTGVPLAPGAVLLRQREACFLEANLEKPLAKPCAAAYQDLASREHLAALIVLGPGLNNALHAQSGRRKELPDYLRGFCVASADSGVPTLLNLTELVLIAITPRGALLAARAWGGPESAPAPTLAPPADLKALSAAQLDALQGGYAKLLGSQAAVLLTHLAASR
jgi:hypothetical protein